MDVAPVSAFLTLKPQSNRTVLLPTAVILVTSVTGKKIPLRALLDSGSQTTFVTEHAVSLLGLKRTAACMAILGIGGRGSQLTKGSVELTITSRVNPMFEVATMGYVLPKITGPQPSTSVVFKDWKHLENLSLADPNYHQPNRIDILLAADVTMMSMNYGKRIAGKPDEPIATATEFGYIVTGKAIQETSSYCHLVTPQKSISQVLQQFWEIEEISQKPLLSPDEEKCEEIFKKTTTRAKDGKFEVAIPFRSERPDLGRSNQVALRRLQGQESRLARAPDLNRQYSEFMADYLAQGHMEEAPNDSPLSSYLPHHAVVRTSVLTTKLRVVFDASAKTANGKSLNDEQLIGPVIQDDLVSILLRFRLHKVAINGDIAQIGIV